MPPAHNPADAAASGDPPALSTLLRFAPYLWPRDSGAQRVRILLAGACVLLSILIQLSMGYWFGAIINRMQPGMQPGVLIAVALVLGYVGARFSFVLFDNLRNVIFERVGQDATRQLAEATFAHLHALSLRFHLSRRTGEVTKVIERGTKSIDIMLYFLLFNVVPTLVQLLAVLGIFAFTYSPWLALATAAMVALYLAFTRAVTDWRNQLRKTMNDLDTQTIGRSVDSLLNYETVKYFSAEQREIGAYGRVARRYADAAVKSENSLAWLNIGQSLITNVMMGGAMAFTVWGWARGWFRPGDVVTINTLLAMLFRPLDMLGMVYRTIRQGLIDMEAMFRLVDTPADVVDAPGAQPLVVTGGAIAFEDVRFSYDADRQILHGVSFAVPAGGTLAIVGPSGSGKSTIARLLFRFFDVGGGRITIDGQDIRQVTQSSLRAAIGIVPQDTVLFNESIGYNIGYGREGADDSAIRSAAESAAISTFIESLPQGYETPVGERGLKLSGGEKQRVAIARTVLKNPPILILDEATSALDSRTEQEILTTLDMIAQSRTTITIAHRLSTIAGADAILVLDGGMVREVGTHDALLAKGGLYAEMWARQAVDETELVPG